MSAAEPLSTILPAHHVYAMSDARDDAEIVCDQKQREPVLRGQLFEHVQDLRLDCHIERCGRLVSHQQLWTGCDGHGDHYALAHPAAEFIWATSSTCTSFVKVRR